MVPLSKEHPQPEVSALKFKIASYISEEAKQRLDLFILKLARNTRNQAYKLIRTNKKLALTRRTIALYNDLKDSSESLYRDGKASFDEVTMVSVEIERLKTLRNKYLTEKNDVLENIYALLAGKKPEVQFKGQKLSLESTNKIESASIETHPLLLSEKTRLQRIQTTIKLIRRMAFPDFTSISSLSPQGNSAVPGAKKHSLIDFNRSFSKQLRSKAQGQNARIKQTSANLKARLNSDLTALRIAKQSHQIIFSRMQPDLESAFASVKSSYENGQTGFAKMVESECRLLDMQNRLIDSEFEILKLKASILFDLGKINF
jgi:outer membrane protein TolC